MPHENILVKRRHRRSVSDPIEGSCDELLTNRGSSSMDSEDDGDDDDLDNVSLYSLYNTRFHYIW